jgi:hypothetical protein
MSSDYEKVADKVGLVPNVRRKDNLYQGVGWLHVGEVPRARWH